MEPPQQINLVVETAQQNGYICTIITSLHGTSQVNCTKPVQNIPVLHVSGPIPDDSA